MHQRCLVSACLPDILGLSLKTSWKDLPAWLMQVCVHWVLGALDLFLFAGWGFSQRKPCLFLWWRCSKGGLLESSNFFLDNHDNVMKCSWAAFFWSVFIWNELRHYQRLFCLILCYNAEASQDDGAFERQVLQSYSSGRLKSSFQLS